MGRHNLWNDFFTGWILLSLVVSVQALPSPSIDTMIGCEYAGVRFLEEQLMKWTSVAAAILLFFGFVAFGNASEENGTWSGWIADEQCGKDYAKVSKAEHQGCAESCVKRGAQWALATKDAHFILDIGADDAMKNLGHEVVIAGELDEETNTIKVTAVTAPEEEESQEDESK